MIDDATANDIADKYVAAKPWSLPDRLIVIHDSTIRKSYGWVFFYTSKRFYETDDFAFAVAGNAPFLVRKETGEIHVFGTAQAIEDYIADYEKERSLAGK